MRVGRHQDYVSWSCAFSGIRQLVGSQGSSEPQTIRQKHKGQKNDTGSAFPRCPFSRVDILAIGVIRGSATVCSVFNPWLDHLPLVSHPSASRFFSAGGLEPKKSAPSRDAPRLHVFPVPGRIVARRRKRVPTQDLGQGRSRRIECASEVRSGAHLAADCHFGRKVRMSGHGFSRSGSCLALLTERWLTEKWATGKRGSRRLSVRRFQSH